ncbi:hypothetical protein C8F01DRAFT_574272 [Mycena amicta]|nr:hypothetical protein C8F01DRAFT_574272 [Mycena amicta]
MSDNALPDEVLSEILAPALTVDDETFSDTTSEVSPFATYTESASAYLLVNKSWLRVATPLLYATVVLRSKAQAKALERALSGNAILGQFIKQLRVEGGYGAPMHHILKLSPNIAHLYLTLVVSSSDSTDGLCKGLALISPKRLILQDTIHYSDQAKNKMVRNLIDAIVKVIPGWPKLTTFHCPLTFYPSSDRWQSISRPLLEARQLHTLTVNFLQDAVVMYSTFKSCPLRSITIKQRLSEYELRYQLEKDDFDPVLKALLKYKTWRNVTPPPCATAPEILPTLNPFYQPMRNIPKDVQDRIWSRILHFAMYVPELGELPMRWNIPATRVSLLTVSSRFQRLGIPHLCVHVYLRNKPSLDSFATLLSKNPHLKSNIRSLVVHAYGMHIPLERILDHQATMQEILPGIDGLRRLSSIRDLQRHTVYYGTEASIAWDTFLAVDVARLEECSIRIATEELAPPAVLSRFAELRVLHWRCETSFDLTSTVLPVDALPALEELIVRESDSSFGILLSRMKLPSLKRARFLQTINSEVLLEIHGNKLSALEIPGSAFLALNAHILDLCPNLTSMTVCWAYQRIQPGGDGASISPPDSDAFDAHNPATSLVEIIFDTVLPLDQPVFKERWTQFLVNTFPHASLPNLQEIRTTAFKWPTTERDIAKNVWVPTAESLLSKNVTLKDSEGKSWRPRLKVGKGAAGAAGAEAAAHSGGRPTRSSTRRAGKK